MVNVEQLNKAISLMEGLPWEKTIEGNSYWQTVKKRLKRIAKEGR